MTSQFHRTLQFKLLGRCMPMTVSGITAFCLNLLPGPAMLAVLAVVTGCSSPFGQDQGAAGREALFTPASSDHIVTRVLTSRDPHPHESEVAQSPAFERALARIEETGGAALLEDRDRIRIPAMREAAVTYGAQSGLTHATELITSEIRKKSKYLTQAYNFEMLMIIGPDGVLVQPPVISEAKEAWESFEEGRLLRIADTVYEIIEQSRLTSAAPVWQNYLFMSFGKPEIPADALLPRNAEEKAAWRKWFRKGWNHGREQAGRIFRTNLNRLNRDYVGMLRYRELAGEGRVSPAVVAQGKLGTTGGGSSVRVNDRVIRITKEPGLLTKP